MSRPAVRRQVLHHVQHRTALVGVRHAHRVVPAPRRHVLHELPPVVGTVAVHPDRRPRRKQRRQVALHLPLPAARHVAPRAQPPADPQTAHEDAVQPVAALPRVQPRRVLEQPTVHLDPGAVHEHRHVAPLRHLVRHHRRRQRRRQVPQDLVQAVHVALRQPPQELAQPAARRRLAKAQQLALRVVPAQRVDVRQRPVARRQRRHQRPLRLRVRRPARTPLHRYRPPPAAAAGPGAAPRAPGMRRRRRPSGARP